MNSPAVILLLFALFPGAASALDTPGEAPAAAEKLETSSRLPDDILSKKREDDYYTGVPAIAVSPDSGIIYGAVIFNFNNGKRSDDRWVYTPYLRKTSILAVQSTKGLSQVKIDLDYPQFLNSSHRLKPSLYITKNISEQYFGVSESTLGKLNYPGDLAAHTGQNATDDFMRYESELQEKRGDGRTWFRYNQYIHQESEFMLVDEIKVWTPYTFLKIGASSARVHIEDYSDKKVDALDPDDKNNEVIAFMAPTRLSEDQAMRLVSGFDGGTVNEFTAGFTVDTRDFEPDPSSGIYSALLAQTSRKETGSTFNYARYTANMRGFYSPLKSVTLGGQLQYMWAEGDVPFWKLPAVGGRNSLKGHRVSRFKSIAASQANTEVRWRATTLGSASQTFIMTPLLYADYGRVYDDAFIMSASGWRRSTGLGLRIIWNQATVIGIEKPLQGEEKSLYVNINHIF